LAAASVTGTVRVEQATIRADGPKHDRDLVVMLDRVGGAPPPPAQGRAVMDQRGMVFVPHVLAIQKGSTVTFLNSDPDPHNVYFLDDRTGRTLDIGTWGPGVSTEHRFDAPGPVIVLCKLHLEMAAYIVVVDSPWFTAVQIDPATRTARFAIADVPAGEYQLTVWHKKLRLLEGPVHLVVPPSGSAEASVVMTTAARAKKGR
jgi:plastocyanin